MADAIEPETPMLDDAVALPRFGLKSGFFVNAVLGLVRTLFSNYRQSRRRVA